MALLFHLDLGVAVRRTHLLLSPRCHHLRAATFVDAKVKWVRDRGLDHAVEKEKHLRPMHALKNLLLRRPPDGPSSTPSLPLSAIAELRDDLRLPFRAIRFIRKYPSAFLEEVPLSDDRRLPHVRPTPDLARLHEEEQLLYHSCRGETADRLLRLLMLAPRKRLPLHVVDRLRWDLGLPDDYARSLLPEYPDYFQIVSSDAVGGGGGRVSTVRGLDLELVCWNKELAVSAMERRAARTGGYEKGDPLAFPLQFSRGFDMEKKVRRWVEDWQRLPYLSPYEDAGRHLDPGSDLAEKWTVGMLHELLHLLVSKKTERDDLLLLGEHVGLRAGFKKALVRHTGIFYASNKIRAHTVVLREAYKRDLLVEKHPLMGMRYQYIHLMRQSAAIDAVTAPVHGSSRRGRDSGRDVQFLEGSSIASRNGEDGDENYVDDREEELSGDSHSESEDESDDDDEQEENEAIGHASPVDRDRYSVRREMPRTGKRTFGAEKIAKSNYVHLTSVASQLRTRKIARLFAPKGRGA